MSTVIIIQRVLPHYRVALYRKLHDLLSKKNIDLKLIYGHECPGAVPKTVSVEWSWAIFIRNSYFNVAGVELVWQHIPRRMLNADLVIFEQANRLINNYQLIFSKTKGRKIAFLGHGKNMQASSFDIKEKLKKRLIISVDWWFAYTDLSKKVVEDAGFPSERISVIQNTIDTASLAKSLSKITDKDIETVKNKLGIFSDNICLFCGGLYPEKKLGFLLEAAKMIKTNMPDFELIIIGSGPEERFIKNASNQLSWFHYVGPKFGSDLATYLRCAKALLMPGSVGLVIIDSFISEVPLITTNNKAHGPEIAYLEHGINAIMAENSKTTYANYAINYLTSSSLQKKLKLGCRASGIKYTIDNMTNNFANGINNCLRIKRH
jgi:glycosyltransferase involved in cell wall biosynthesis